MSDSLLPQIPGAGVPGALPQAIQPQQPAAMPRPPGRPADDPQKQEERAARHVNRKRVESVLPQRAKDCKLLIYRKVAGRLVPGRKPVLTVLITDLEAAKENGIDTDEYLQDRLAEKLGDDAVGTYEVSTVDARNNALNEIPKFELVVGDGTDPAEEDDGEGDDEGPTDEELRRFEQREREERMQAGATQAPVQATQGQLPQMAQMQFDELSRRNRDEGKAEAQNNTALLMQIMMQGNQAQQAAAAQQTQLFMAMMEKQQAPKSNVGELIAALAPLLLPVITRMMDKTPDPLLLKLLEQPKTNAAESMLQTIPTILGKVAEQQMSLQHQGADQAIKMATANAAANAETQAKINGLMMGHLTDTLKSVLNQAADMKNAKDKEGDDKGGGGLMETIGKVAAAVLPQIMGQQQAPPQESYEQQPAALPAPAAPTPAPVRVPARRAPPPPAAAAPQPAPAPPRAAPRDANSKIRGLLAAVADLRSGKISADQRWGVIRFISNNAPPPMLAAIKADSFEGVLEAGRDAVLASPPLLQWLAEPNNQAFLKDMLEDTRKLAVGPLDDSYMARRVAELQALHGQAVTAAPAPRMRKPKQGPPGSEGSPPSAPASEAPPAPSAPASEAPPAPSAPEPPADPPKPGG